MDQIPTTIVFLFIIIAVHLTIAFRRKYSLRLQPLSTVGWNK